MVETTIDSKSAGSNAFDLPKGWTQVFLEECVDILDSKRVPVNSKDRLKRKGGSVPYYGATGQVGWIDDYLFDEQLLLLGEDGAPFFDKSKPISYIINGKSWVNNHAHVLRAISSLTSNEFLKFYLDQFDFTGLVSGTTRLKLNQSSMKKIQVKLPPVAEQRRIVAKLEKLLAKVDDCKERLEKIPIILKRFRQSVLAAACSGQLTAEWRDRIVKPFNISEFIQKIRDKRKELGLKKREIVYRSNGETPPTWVKAKLSFFIESMANGIYKPSEFYSDDGIACLRMYNIQNGEIVWENIKRMILTESELSKYSLQNGDILVNRVNSRELVGKGAIIRSVAEPVVFESKNIRLRLVEREIMPIFVNYCFMLRIVRDSFEESAKQTVGMATISQPQISELVLPIPPIEEQKEIISRVNGLFRIADEIQARYEKAKRHVDHLTQSILAKAFRGELVPQDPNDEPASEVLKRIKEEREQSRKQQKAIKKKGQANQRKRTTS